MSSVSLFLSPHTLVSQSKASPVTKYLRILLSLQLMDSTHAVLHCTVGQQAEQMFRSDTYATLAAVTILLMQGMMDRTDYLFHIVQCSIMKEGL